MPKKKVDLHQKLMDQAYARWQRPANNGWNIEQFMEQLSDIERFAVTTGNFNYQVENGGFSQWRLNGYATHSTVRYLIESVSKMVVLERAVAAKDVFEMLKEYLLLERDGEITDDDHTPLNNLDKWYYKVSEQFMVECEAHLQNMAKALVG